MFGINLNFKSTDCILANVFHVKVSSSLYICINFHLLYKTNWFSFFFFSYINKIFNVFEELFFLWVVAYHLCVRLNVYSSNYLIYIKGDWWVKPVPPQLDGAPCRDLQIIAFYLIRAYLPKYIYIYIYVANSGDDIIDYGNDYDYKHIVILLNQLGPWNH